MSNSTTRPPLLFAFIILILSPVALAADPPPARPNDPLAPAFQLLRTAIDNDEIPGAIALVARNGTILRHEAMGVRDPVNKVPFTTDTLCWMASITKPVTTAAAMVLVDQGKLSLDDSVEKFLPDFARQTDEAGAHHVVTIRHLMTHTSGLPGNPPTRRSGWPIGGALDDSWLQANLPEIVHSIARARLRFTPGSKVEYSNSAFFVLGRIIELASGAPYDAFVRETLLQPLGMNDTYYIPPPAAGPRVSPIYGRREGRLVPVFQFNPQLKITNPAPDGGLFCYPAQLVKFLQLFLDNDGRILSRTAVAEMLKQQAPGRGLGWAFEDGLFLHDGSSGTLAFADPNTGVVGILFFQFQDDKGTVPRLRKEFRQAVRSAFADRP